MQVCSFLRRSALPAALPLLPKSAFTASGIMVRKPDACRLSFSLGRGKALALARCLGVLFLFASAWVGIACAQHQSGWNSTKSPDVARRLAQQVATPPVPVMSYKSPVMRRLWEGRHHHHVTDARQFPGDMTSPFLTTPPMYSAGSNPFDVALGDFNSDGKQDAIVAANPPVLLLGNGDGTLQAATPIGTISSAPTGVAVADFNHDGRLDVVFAIPGAAVVYLGNGDGTFGAGATFQSGGANQNVFARVLAEDVNNDGIMDLILNTDAGISVLLGKGNGTFKTAKTSSAVAQYMAAADFNKDGTFGPGSHRWIRKLEYSAWQRRRHFRRSK